VDRRRGCGGGRKEKRGVRWIGAGDVEGGEGIGSVSA